MYTLTSFLPAARSSAHVTHKESSKKREKRAETSEDEHGDYLITTETGRKSDPGMKEEKKREEREQRVVQRESERR